jgi:hypothetical protein
MVCSRLKERASWWTSRSTRGRGRRRGARGRRGCSRRSGAGSSADSPSDTNRLPLGLPGRRGAREAAWNWWRRPWRGGADELEVLGPPRLARATKLGLALMSRLGAEWDGASGDSV